VKKIPLNNGKVALVDDEDYARALAPPWYWNGRYVVCSLKIRRGKFKTQGLHRFILKAKQGQMVDHKNHDTLDNQRSNLRICDNRQNQGNQKYSFRGISRYRGVHFVPKRNVWQAAIRDHGRIRWLGYFESEFDAAKRYDREAVRVFGEFANLNFKVKHD